jgi:Matrixin
MFKNNRKIIVSIILAITFLIFLVPPSKTAAYVLFGGHKLTHGPYYTKYFTDVLSVPSYSTINAVGEVNMSMSRWNNTQNTRVWMQQTTIQTESIMDIHSIYDVEIPNVAGYTSYWRGGSSVNPYNTDWYWAKIAINNRFAWGIALNSPSANYAGTVAHEIGHGLGLNHTSNEYTLMFPDAHTLAFNDIIWPTQDEVAGVQALYGTLN